MKKQFIMFVVGALVVISVVFIAISKSKLITPTLSTEVGPWTIEEAQFLKFDSICDLRLELSRPKALVIGGEWTTTGCSTLDEQLEKPLAIMIKVRNSGERDLNLTLPLLSDVVIHVGSKINNPLAFYLPTSWLPWGGGWITEEDGG